ncbi:RagB/SusD family nutrient uptake outer membrane protein, partial [Bacteroides sp. OttesenSCG-928-M17]|nr:RagB/SusD family nutrient uptake outer membrane protein [Bacteroides sp. OttesenSCG-928-M17]
MKQYIHRYLLAGLMAVLLGTTSCTDYLDKAPESEISSGDAYKNFTNFQGFTEELYYCIPDFSRGYWTNSWNWGEDEIINVGIDYHMCYKVDQGDFWGWQSEHDGWQSGWMDRRGSDPTKNDRFAKSLWPLAWYGIRKCNMGIEALNNGMLVGATQEERNLIEGQLHFFRGWFHFELIQFFGGLPYIDSVLPSGEKLTLAR